MSKIVKSDAEWRTQLSAEEYEVARGKGTERPFSGRYHDCKDEGVYACICCGEALLLQLLLRTFLQCT